MNGRRGKERQAVSSDSSPTMGLLKRTLVEASTCTHAAVGAFRGTKDEELVLSFETSIQLLSYADGTLEEVCRQHLYASARDIGVVSQSKGNCFSEDCDERDLLVVLTEDCFVFLRFDSSLQRFQRACSVSLNFHGFTAVTVDAGRSIIVLSGETHNRVALYQLRWGNQAVQCHMVVHVHVYGGHILDAAPEVKPYGKGNAAEERGTLGQGWGQEPLDSTGGVVSICFPCGCTACDTISVVTLLRGSFFHLIHWRLHLPSGKIQTVAHTVLQPAKFHPGPEADVLGLYLPAAVMAVPKTVGAFVVLRGSTALLFNLLQQREGSHILKPCHERQIVTSDEFGKGAAFAHAVWEREPCLLGEASTSRGRQASGSALAGPVGFGPKLLVATRDGRLSRVTVEWPWTNDGAWNGSGVLDAEGHGTFHEGNKPYNGELPFTWGQLHVLEAHWEARAEVSCLASFHQGVFITTGSGSAYLGAGWDMERTPSPVPLGLGYPLARYVPSTPTPKHFVLADLLNENQNQVYAASGIGEAGCLHIIQGGRRVTPVYESEPGEFPGVTGIWSVRARATDDAHAVVVLSFISGTRALAPGRGSSDLRDVTEHVPLAADVATVACGRVIDGVMAQVTPDGVLLCSLKGLPESEGFDAEKPGDHMRRRTPSGGLEGVCANSGDDSGEDVYSTTSPLRPAFSAMAISRTSTLGLRASEDVWSAGCTIGAAAIGEGIIVLSCHVAGRSQKEARVVALGVVLEELVSSPGKRKRAHPQPSLRELASIHLDTDVSCIDVTASPPGGSHPGLERAYRKVILVGTYDPGLRVLVLTKEGTAGMPARLTCIATVSGSEMQPPRLLSEPPAAADVQTIPESVLLAGGDGHMVQALVGWRNGTVNQLVIHLRDSRGWPLGSAAGPFSPAQAHVEAVASMCMGEMPAVLVRLPGESRVTGVPLSALIACDRVSMLTIPALGRRASIAPLAMASVACVAPLWMSHDAVPLDPRRVQRMLLVATHSPAAPGQGGGLSLVEMEGGPATHTTPLPLGATPTRVAAHSASGLAAVLCGSPLGGSQLGRQLLLVDPRSGAIACRQGFLPNEEATSLSTMTLHSEERAASYLAAALSWEDGGGLDPARLPPSFLHQYSLRPSFRPSAARCSNSPALAPSSVLRRRGRPDARLGIDLGGASLPSSSRSTVTAAWQATIPTASAADNARGGISRQDSGMGDDTDVMADVDGTSDSADADRRWRNVHKELLLVGTRADPSSDGIADYPRVGGRVLVLAVRPGGGGPETACVRLLAEAKLAEPVLDVCAYGVDGVVAITSMHVICFKLVGSVLKKQYHMLLRTGLRGINPLPSPSLMTTGNFSPPKTLSGDPPKGAPLLCVTDDVNGAVLLGHSVDHGFQVLGSCRRAHVVNCAVPLEIPGGPAWRGSRKGVLTLDVEGNARVALQEPPSCTPERNLDDVATVALPPSIHIAAGDMTFRGVFGTRAPPALSFIACTTLGGVCAVQTLDPALYAVLAAFDAAMRRHPVTAPPCDPTTTYYDRRVTRRDGMSSHSGIDPMMTWGGDVSSSRRDVTVTHCVTESDSLAMESDPPAEGGSATPMQVDEGEEEVKASPDSAEPDSLLPPWRLQREAGGQPGDFGPSAGPPLDGDFLAQATELPLEVQKELLDDMWAAHGDPEVKHMLETLRASGPFAALDLLWQAVGDMA